MAREDFGVKEGFEYGCIELGRVVNKGVLGWGDFESWGGCVIKDL